MKGFSMNFQENKASAVVIANDKTSAKLLLYS